MSEQIKGLELKSREAITLRQMPNNGWVIQQGGYMNVMPSDLGAYSDTKDMLYALTKALLSESKPNDI
jgi:hypothetical protein